MAEDKNKNGKLVDETEFDSDYNEEFDANDIEITNRINSTDQDERKHHITAEELKQGDNNEAEQIYQDSPYTIHSGDEMAQITKDLYNKLEKDAYNILSKDKELFEEYQKISSENPDSSFWYKLSELSHKYENQQPQAKQKDYSDYGEFKQVAEDLRDAINVLEKQKDKDAVDNWRLKHYKAQLEDLEKEMER